MLDKRISTPSRPDAHEGAILVIAMLMLSMISSIAFVVSSLVYRNVTLERAYDDALTAFYAAESGVERALDIANIKRSASESMTAAENSIESFASASSPYSLEQSGAKYSIDATASGVGVDQLQTLVNTRTQVDLYNPDDPFSYLQAESIRFAWNMPSSCPATARIEASFFRFNSTSIGRADDLVYKQVFSCGAEVPATSDDCQATSNFLTPNTNYRIALWSMECPLIDLTTTVYSADNASGSIVPIPSIVQWSAIGTGSLSRRQMTVTTKWLPSASGLAEFVLFSLSQITK